MNVDPNIPQAPFSVLPTRPVQQTAGPASARPVDRPHHSEPSNNQQKPDSGQIEARKDNERPSAETRTVRQESELSQEEKRDLERLKARDREVRAHEAAHKAAAGDLARGNARLEMETGPDGRRYAVGGEVSIDTGKVEGDPQATLDKAQTIRRAATAPAQPSSQDRAVAAEATRMEAEARRELREAAHEEHNAAARTPARGGFSDNPTRPSPIGDLLDVIA